MTSNKADSGCGNRRYAYTMKTLVGENSGVESNLDSVLELCHRFGDLFQSIEIHEVIELSSSEVIQ